MTKALGGSESISDKAMVISHEQFQDVVETLEDFAEYLCDKHTLSGELLWTCTNAYSEARLCEIRGELG